MTIQYPMLLTLSEPGTLTGTYQQKGWPMPHDVYRADYQPGAFLSQDRLSNLRKIASKRGQDEIGEQLQPDGSMWLTMGHEICRLQNDGQVIQTLPPLNSAAVAASSNGDFVWAVESQTGKLYQWSSQTNRWDTIWDQGRVDHIHSHPSANKVHFVTRQSWAGNSTVREWDADKRLEHTLNLPFQAYEVKFSPDCKVLAFVDSKDDEVKTYHLDTGAIQKVSDFDEETDDVPCDAQFHASPQWSPDGRRLFYTIGTMKCQEEDIVYTETLMAATPDGAWRRVILGSGPNRDGVNSLRT